MHRRGLGVRAALASFLLALPSAAGAAETTQVGIATISLDAGVQSLYVPDVNFIELTNAGFTTIEKLETNDADSELGLGLTGAIEFPTSILGAQSLAIRGFYGSIENDEDRVCTSSATLLCVTTPIIDDGTGKVAAGAGVHLATTSERDITVWGVALEGKHYLGGWGGAEYGMAAPRRYWALGGDVRGLDQSLDLVSTTPNGAQGTANYSEDLDTTYYGAYLAYGGGYSLPFLGGITSSLGLQSSFRLWGGLYYADTDYSGSYTRNLVVAANQRLSLSDDDAAFIGGLTLETRKQIGSRTALSLRSDYEYYSYVPEMQYNETVNGAQGSVTGTSIDSDDAFSMRTMLNLTIGLGPDQLYTQ